MRWLAIEAESQYQILGNVNATSLYRIPSTRTSASSVQGYLNDCPVTWKQNTGLISKGASLVLLVCLATAGHLTSDLFWSYLDIHDHSIIWWVIDIFLVAVVNFQSNAHWQYVTKKLKVLKLTLVEHHMKIKCGVPQGSVFGPLFLTEWVQCSNSVKVGKLQNKDVHFTLDSGTSNLSICWFYKLLSTNIHKISVW